MGAFTSNYELALTTISDVNKINQTKMLQQRLMGRVKSSRACHEEAAILTYQAETAMANISGAGTVVTPKPNPGLIAYSDRAAQILTEIESLSTEVQAYKTESENALAAANSCLNTLLELLPESNNIEGGEQLTNNDVEPETVSGGGFTEVSQSGGAINEQEFEQEQERMDPEVQEAIKDYYRAQRLSNYGTKGFNKHTIGNMVNDMQAKQQNETARQELNNLALDMIRNSEEYFGEMAIGKNQNNAGKTAEEDYTDKYLSTDFYNKYYEGFNIDPDNPNAGTSDPDEFGGEEADPFSGDALIIMGEDATPFTNDYQTSLGEIDSQEAAALQEAGASVPDDCVFYYYDKYEEIYKYTIRNCREENPKYLKVFGPATFDACAKWIGDN